ncbi:uncharacterized protein MELLADRAFT_91912 [Melampsora larici-populina 98AG31]|uniref:Uncharacterized protein n=1 Tax=Melampsora larici-populina (strain 98AG31 / pathotype 3-4-7) TaxID=747676 RepID=F4S0U5_MELLP|nr:uncharacterized protein MELLADRAFT_91912 [Melampsora larici-populina 98AG31]EGG01649.1 hypothetical protein MELLADRAFT_91912 [Melampsora larici-populina 98AG31]
MVSALAHHLNLLVSNFAPHLHSHDFGTSLTPNACRRKPSIRSQNWRRRTENSTKSARYHSFPLQHCNTPFEPSKTPPEVPYDTRPSSMPPLPVFFTRPVVMSPLPSTIAEPVLCSMSSDWSSYSPPSRPHSVPPFPELDRRTRSRSVHSPRFPFLDLASPAEHQFYHKLPMLSDLEPSGNTAKHSLETPIHTEGELANDSIVDTQMKSTNKPQSQLDPTQESCVALRQELRELDQTRESQAELRQELSEVRAMIEALLRSPDHLQTDVINSEPAKSSDQAAASYDHPIKLLSSESHSDPMSSLPESMSDNQVGPSCYQSIKSPPSESLSNRISLSLSSKSSDIDPDPNSCITTLARPDSTKLDLNAHPLNSTTISNSVIDPNSNKSLTRTNQPTPTDQTILTSSVAHSAVCDPTCVPIKKKKKKKTKAIILETEVPDTLNFELTPPAPAYGPGSDNYPPPPTQSQIQELSDILVKRHPGLCILETDDQGFYLGKDCNKSPFDQDVLLYSFDGTLIFQLENGISISTT